MQSTDSRPMPLITKLTGRKRRLAIIVSACLAAVWIGFILVVDILAYTGRVHFGVTAGAMGGMLASTGPAVMAMMSFIRARRWLPVVAFVVLWNLLLLAQVVAMIAIGVHAG